jgi:hypothetical protein
MAALSIEDLLKYAVANWDRKIQHSQMRSELSYA